MQNQAGRKVRSSGNFEILPASLLPLKAKWKAISQSLPEGSALIILPPINNSLRNTLEIVAALLQADGHRVITVPTTQFM